MIDQPKVDTTGDTVVVDMNGWAFPDPELGAASQRVRSVDADRILLVGDRRPR